MSKVFGITGQKLADTGGRIKKRYHQMLEEANMIIRDRKNVEANYERGKSL